MRLVIKDTNKCAVITFNMDEYVGLPEEHPESYHSFMWNNFFDYDINKVPKQALSVGIATVLAASELKVSTYKYFNDIYIWPHFLFSKVDDFLLCCLESRAENPFSVAHLRNHFR